MAVLFGKKKAVVNITKLYFFVSEEEGFDLRWIGENVLRYCSGVPSKFSVNFGRNRGISNLTGIMPPSKLQYFDVISSEGAMMLALGQVFIKSISRLMHECTVVSDFDRTFCRERELIACFDDRFEVVYGYSRVLREDYHPTSETKIRKGLFGTELRVEKLSVWLFSPYEMCEGSVKGIYPVNYWKENALGKLKEVGFDVNHRGGNIFHFSDAEGEEMKKGRSKYKDFVRFDGLGT